MLDTDFIAAAEQGSRRLMIVLHGLGDSMEGYRWWPDAMQLPWLNYLLANAPDPYYGGFAWYDLQDPEEGVRRSSKLLLQLLDQWMDKDFPTEQIVLFGFSQGCLMAVEIGARLRRRLAGIVGISGYVLDPEDLVKHLGAAALSQRILMTHGTQDPLIPIDRVRPQIEILRRAGLQIQWHEFVKGHTIAGEAEMAVVRGFVEACYA
jgi:phospholipase/carboxylesterase